MKVTWYVFQFRMLATTVASTLVQTINWAQKPWFNIL